MKKPIHLVLLLATSLALPACGDGDAGKEPSLEDMGLPADFDPNDPDAVRDVVAGFSRSVASAELTDEILGDLYEIHKRLKEAEDDPSEALALLKGSSWNIASYTKAMMKFEALRSAKRRGADKVLKRLEESKAELAKIESRLAAAAAEEKAALEQQLSMAKMMLPTLEEQAKLVEQLKDPKVRAFVEKWSAKFDALDAE